MFLLYLLELSVRVLVFSIELVFKIAMALGDLIDDAIYKRSGD